MKLSQLQKKYPKAFKLLTKSKRIKFESFWHHQDDDIRAHWKGITDFMDKQGIYIAYYIDEYAPPLFIYYIYDKVEKKEYKEDTVYEKRFIMETKAIKKAFEILEERSKE